jgi:two-component system, NtrC family, response regulator HydG
MEKILIIDDDADVCLLLDRFLKRQSYEVEVASSGKLGMEKLMAFKPDLILSDFKLGDMNGADLLTNVKSKFPNLPVIIITGYSDIKVAIEVLKNGAFDYVTKPLFPDEILDTIKKALMSVSGSVKTEAKEEKAETEKSKKTKKDKPKYIFGKSFASKNLVNQINVVAPTDFSVIIYGESGSGKEAVANEIHLQSKRKNKPFVAMDCGAVSKELAGSELFGHEKGSFTGAINDKVGLFELADGGTLFLDEVGNLPYDIQVSLLRVVQERRIKKIGGNKEKDVDVRIIVASNTKLINAAKEGKFREDLYYRFNEFEIEVPPLRDRENDIMMYAEFMLENVNVDLDKDIKGFSDEVVEVFKSYPWHGNIRELKNVVRRAALLSQAEIIKVANLPYELVNHNHVFFSDSDSNASQAQFLSVNQNANTNAEKPNEPIAKPNFDLKEAAKEAEAELIIKTLKEVNYNKSKAAQKLNIDRKTLYNKLKYYNL